MSRVYEDKPNVLGFDMGEKMVETWARFDFSYGRVTVDHAAMNGDLILSPHHAELLGSRLLQWSNNHGTPRERHLLSVIDAMSNVVAALRQVVFVFRDDRPNRLEHAIFEAEKAIKAYDDHSKVVPNA